MKRLFPGHYLLLMSILISGFVMIGMVSLGSGQTFTPPPESDIPPIISMPSEIDIDRSKVDDQLEATLLKTKTDR